MKVALMRYSDVRDRQGRRGELDHPVAPAARRPRRTERAR
jgi:hypothetical protein